jgi:multiple sugar transport system substrate-binding protein
VTLKYRHTAGLAAVLVTTSLALPAVAQDAFDWRKFEGSTVEVLIPEGPFLTAATPVIAAFEEATGITVELEQLPEAQAWDKIRVEMQANSDAIDLYIGQIDRFGTQFSANGWYQDLMPYIKDGTLTSPDFDWMDFREPSRSVSTIGGQVVGIPIDRPGGPVVVFRRDLLEVNGIALPTTLEELEAAARAIHATAGIPGMVLRGNGAGATSQFSNILHEFGGRWQDEAGNPTINTPEAVAAFDWWGRMLRETGNPNATTFGFPEVVSEFLSGNAVFGIDGALAVPAVINDPATSLVAGKVGYMAIPNGPGGPTVRQTDPCRTIGPLAVSINPFAEDREAAWFLAQWLTSKQAQVDLLLTGRLVARASAAEAERFTTDPAVTNEKEYWDAVLEASSFCYPTVGNAPPSIADVGRAREIIGQVIVASILGQDVQTAAEQAQAELEALKAAQ